MTISCMYAATTIFVFLCYKFVCTERSVLKKIKPIQSVKNFFKDNDITAFGKFALIVQQLMILAFLGATGAIIANITVRPLDYLGIQETRTYGLVVSGLVGIMGLSDALKFIFKFSKLNTEKAKFEQSQQLENRQVPNDEPDDTKNFKSTQPEQ